MIDIKLEEEAKQGLKDFLGKTIEFLNKIVNNKVDKEGQPFFIEKLLPEIKKAWKEFQEDFDVEEAKKLVDKMRSHDLQSHGLYGHQLKLKLSTIDSWRDRFLRKRTKKLLLRLLDAIDTLLDSLIQAAGVDKALKEIKDILRNSIDED